MRRQPRKPFVIQCGGLNVGRATATIGLDRVLPPGAVIRSFGAVQKTAGTGTGTLAAKIQARGTSTDLSGSITIDADGAAETDHGTAIGISSPSSSARALELDLTLTGSITADVIVDLFIVCQI